MPDWIEPPAEYDHSKTLHENKQRSRGILRCHCGGHVDLYAAAHAPDYAAECPRCDALYNLSGQELLPKAQWEESYDDY
jgi:hypothetical protein